MSSEPLLDFDVVKEPWNKYELSDRAVLKTKLVLTKIMKEHLGNLANAYAIDFQNFAVILTDERGQLGTRIYSREELQASIVEDNIKCDPISEEWNEYAVNDGGQIRIQSKVIRVAKTSLFDLNGKPIYWVESNQIPEIKPLQVGIMKNPSDAVRVSVRKLDLAIQ